MTAPNERTMWTAPHGLADVTLDDWGLFRVRTRDSYGRWHHIHAGYSTFEHARMTAEIADNARAYKAPSAAEDWEYRGITGQEA